MNLGGTTNDFCRNILSSMGNCFRQASGVMCARRTHLVLVNLPQMYLHIFEIAQLLD